MADLPVRPEPTPSGPNRAARRAARRRSAPRETIARAYVGVAEAATYLDLSEKSIRRLIDRGELKAYMFGPKVLRLKLADLDAVFTVRAVGE